MSARRVRAAALPLSFRVLMLIAWCTAFPAAAGAGDGVAVRVFEPGDLERIRAEHSGRAFVLMAWSLDCLPCHRKLSRLRPVLDANPDWRLVLVAVDDPDRAAEVSQRIAEFRLELLDQWRFGDLPAERLRHALDADWFGELPRAWFHDALHQVTGISGNFPDELLKQHFASSQGDGP